MTEPRATAPWMFDDEPNDSFTDPDLRESSGGGFISGEPSSEDDLW